MKNFLITGYGRSGTTWLCRLMNRSSRWTVKHEPGGRDERPVCQNRGVVPADIQARFTRDYYGEVNSRLRWVVMGLSVAKKGVIIRNPIDVWISTGNRKSSFKHEHELARMERSFEILGTAVSSGVARLIDFNRMTGELDYIEKLLTEFGVEDVGVAEEDLQKKVNKGHRRNYEKLSDFPPEIVERVEAMTARTFELIQWRVERG